LGRDWNLIGEMERRKTGKKEKRHRIIESDGIYSSLVMIGEAGKSTKRRRN